MNLHKNLMQETCESFLRKFLDCVSPPLHYPTPVSQPGAGRRSLAFT